LIFFHGTCIRGKCAPYVAHVPGGIASPQENALKKKVFLMDENEVATLIVNAAYNIHITLEPGLLE
jgi:hypothetical protein